MATVGQGQKPTEFYQDYSSIINAIGRMTVAHLKGTIKRISESSISGHLSTQGLKKALQDRLIDHFTRLKDGNMAGHYQESRRILESEFGSTVSHQPRSFNYTPAAPISAPDYRSAANQASYQVQQQRQQQYLQAVSRQRGAFISSPQAFQSPHGSSTLASASVSASNNFLPSIRPHFRSSPFLEVIDWVGPATICPEAPGSQQRGSTTIKLQLTPGNLELLRRSTGIHQLRLFCTTKTYFDAATNANHPAPVEFPLSCEVKVNHIPLSVNLKGKKTAAKVLAPHLNKDHALYFGGQDNKVELVYTGTSQKYVLSVAICEIRQADTLARRIKREKIRSKADVISAMKKAADDDDIEMGDVSMGLKCPLGAMRMTAPVRSTVCVHMQCFDALSFLSLNEQTPSWQCPICDKMINPDTLFLDGYVLDILESLPEDEETVLVDAVGKWHTPNKKFSSEIAEQPMTPPRDAVEPSAANGVQTTNTSLKTEFPFGSTPPPPEPQAESYNKKAVEVFEIDDDDSPLPKEKTWQREQAQMQAQTQTQMDALRQSREKAIQETQRQEREIQKAKAPTEIVTQARASPPQPALQRLPSNSIINGNGNGIVRRQTSSREPSQSRMTSLGQTQFDRPFGVALKDSPALPSPGLAPPSIEDVIPKPIVEVIDLTFSDSDEEDMPPPPRRRLNSTVNGQSSTNASTSSLVARQPSLPSAAKVTPHLSLPRRPTVSPINNGAQDGSITKGFVRPSPPGRASNGVVSNGTHNYASAQKSTSDSHAIPTRAPMRRSNSYLSGDDEEDEDEDESQPVIGRHWKRARMRRRAYSGSEEEGESSSVERSSGGTSENSESLYEDERAGLAVRP